MGRVADVPQAQRVVGAAGDQSASVGTECDGVGVAAKPAEDCNELRMAGIGDVPERDVMVGARDREQLPVGAEVDAEDLARVPVGIEVRDARRVPGLATPHIWIRPVSSPTERSFMSGLKLSCSM